MDWTNQWIEKDHQLLIYLNNLGSPEWDSFWLFITDKYTWFPLYAVFLFIIYRRYNLKVLLLTMVVAALMITATDQITNLFKDVLVMRLRPCYDERVIPYIRMVKDHCGGQHGFFSGHSSNHFAIAVFLGLVLRKYKYLLPALLIWAGFIAYSRLYIAVHYPLDVLAGTLAGALLGFLFYTLWKWLAKKYFHQKV